MSEFAVILVYTTSHAVQAEKVLQGAGKKVRLVPTPRHLSSDCGAAVRIVSSEREACGGILKEAGVEFDRIELLDG